MKKGGQLTPKKMIQTALLDDCFKRLTNYDQKLLMNDEILLMALIMLFKKIIGANIYRITFRALKA